MSSGQSPSVTELAAFIFQLETFYAENLCWISIAALTAYDYLITFEHEVNFFWNRMFTGTTVLFLMNRYFSLFTFAIYACIASPKEFERCVVTYYITVFIEGFYYIPWAAFSALRAYALCGQKWPFPILIFILGLAPVVTNYYANLHVVLVPAAPGGAVGCEAINPSITPAIVRILLYVTRGALILADIIVLAITWSATYQLSKQNRALRKASSLSEILLRDG